MLLAMVPLSILRPPTATTTVDVKMVDEAAGAGDLWNDWWLWAARYSVSLITH